MGVQFRGSIPGLLRTPVNASLVPLRTTKMHDSGSAWVASPSLHETFIHNTLPALTGALNFERTTPI